MKRVLTNEQVTDICTLYETGEHNCTSLSNLYNVNVTTINKYLKTSGIKVTRRQLIFKKPKVKEGDIYITKEGYEAKVLVVMGTKNITIYLNGQIVEGISQGALLKGEVKSRNKLSVFGIGYIGYGKHTVANGKKAYSRWCQILKRGYCKDYKIKSPSYEHVTVCEEWHNFQNFAQWYYKNWKPWMDNSWHLDKDLLVKENKVYSPETCAFVPQILNNLYLKSNILNKSLPLGVRFKNGKYKSYISKNGVSRFLGYFLTEDEAFESYRDAKEEYIKESAYKWKELIDTRVYKTLMEYKIDIKD